MFLDFDLSEAEADYLLRFLDRLDVAWLSTVARSTQEELREMFRHRNQGLPQDLRVNFITGYYNIAAGYKLLLQREGRYPMIYALGGWDLEAVCSFDPFTRVWAPGPSMPTARSNHRAVGVDGRIWAVGGVSYVRSGAHSEVECFDTRSQSWASHAPLTQPRYNFGCASLDGKLYAVGGEFAHGFAHGRISSMEIFDPATNQWTPGPSLPRARNGLTLEAVNGKLFAIGGCVDRDDDDDGHMPGQEEEVAVTPTAEVPLTTVECFDPQTGLWSLAAPMNIPRSGHASTVVDGCVIVMGGATQDGHVDERATNTVERFSPTSNTWTMMPSMTFPRDNFGAATWHGTVIAVGGFSTGQTGEWFRVLPGQQDASWVQTPDMENTQLGLCVASA